ncbi:sensor histidine kinase [Murinocardiopsis flavida]|nr:ATP-binding protein [Murinocardiopsis flavida]
MSPGRARLRLARWLESTVDEPPPSFTEAPRAPDDTAEAWQGVCDRFSLQVLGLAEQLRPALDRLEDDEQDPDRLQRLYEIDHAVTRMRRSARDLRVLADSRDEELDGHITSLTDVIRVAESSIEHYTRVQAGTVARLAVVSYAADDVASILAALLENATAYSPSTVVVSAHLLESGGVMFRIEDSGIGLEEPRLAQLNARLAAEIPPVDERTGRRTGFPVVHRLARRHGITVRLTRRSPAGAGRPGGTTAMVTLPPGLVCEAPSQGPAIGPAQPAAAPRPASPPRAPSPAPSAQPAAAAPTDLLDALTPSEPLPVRGGGEPLPRRERKSLRGRADSTGPAGQARPLAQRESDTAGRSFADDLGAFTAPGPGASRPAGAAAGGDSPAEPEDEVP